MSGTAVDSGIWRCRSSGRRASSWVDVIKCERWVNEKLAIDKLQMRKYGLYMRYEGGPMNGVECPRW